MHIVDLNECLSELPEISVLDHMFRPRNPVSRPFSWTAEKWADRQAANQPKRPNAA